jgi:hypothetical protein
MSRRLETLVVEHKPLDQILIEPGCGPLAKPGALSGTHPVAHSDDRGQRVVVQEPRNLTISLTSNYSEFPNSCPRVELVLFVDVLQVLVYRWDRHAVELGHQALGEPHGALSQAHVNPT